MVARLRGVTFEKGVVYGEYLPTPSKHSDAVHAVQDVARWLRFVDSTLYLDALETEGRAIFKRAKRPKNRREPKASRP